MRLLRSALVTIVAACCFLPPEAANSNNARLLFFTASWCAPCQKMKPAVESLARKYKVDMILVDFHASPLAVRDFKVESLPTIVLLDSKGQLLFKAEGAGKQTMDALVAALKTLTRQKKRP
ncbi:MAG TPA: thioredoxin family protein [Acidobacteriota bacterium]|nr:thioredoxin family protein [Acidobacteriota bacterium]